MNKKITLSYVLTTHDKLPYLKEVMKRLLENVQPDEEIVIADGASTDGTVEYLTELFNQGKIHQFISEPDFGEAHGFNKGILMARGELIKILTDDDVFDHMVIAECKEYMISNVSIDLIFANICYLNHSLSSDKLLLFKSYEIWFKEWADRKVENCFFCGISILIRKNSLSFIGLLDTSFKHVDLEYSIRVTSKKANIAFCSHIMTCAILNEMSISRNFEYIQKKEVERVSAYYNYISLVGEKPVIPEPKNIIYRILKKLGIYNPVPKKEYYQDYNYELNGNIVYEDLPDLFNKIPKFITEYNDANKLEFISNININ